MNIFINAYGEDILLSILKTRGDLLHASRANSSLTRPAASQENGESPLNFVKYVKSGRFFHSLPLRRRIPPELRLILLDQKDYRQKHLQFLSSFHLN